MQITIEQYEQINPAATLTVDGKSLVYCTPNRRALWRVQTLFTKEPDTIQWLNGLAPGSVLYDIGANVGMYSLYAAVLRGVSVLAFEPESQNYALLNKNIFCNRMGQLVRAYPLALSDAPSVDLLHLSQFEAGGSLHNFGETVDYKGEAFQPGFSQGCLAMALDTLVEQHGLPVPDHIKIDVDGIEHKVLAGAARTLRRPEVKSVLVELNTNLESHRELVTLMESLGFRLQRELLELALRQDGAFKGVGNHIFVRA
jgi:FkbM family methyltransferase